MEFKITTLLNDGLAEAPPITVETDDNKDIDSQIYWLAENLHDEITNDYGDPFGVGTTWTIERVA